MNKLARSHILKHFIELNFVPLQWGGHDIAAFFFFFFFFFFCQACLKQAVFSLWKNMQTRNDEFNMLVSIEEATWLSE